MTKQLPTYNAETNEAITDIDVTVTLLGRTETSYVRFTQDLVTEWGTASVYETVNMRKTNYRPIYQVMTSSVAEAAEAACNVATAMCLEVTV